MSIQNKIGEQIVRQLTMFGREHPVEKKQIMGVVHRSRADVAMREFRKLAQRAQLLDGRNRPAYYYEAGAYHMSGWYYQWLKRHCVA